MSAVVRISEILAKEARSRSKIEHRSVTAQIEYWASIGKIAKLIQICLMTIRQTLLAKKRFD